MHHAHEHGLAAAAAAAAAAGSSNIRSLKVVRHKDNALTQVDAQLAEPRFAERAPGDVLTLSTRL